MFKRPVAKTAAVLALAVAGTTVGAAPPAEAQVSCDQGYTCVYNSSGTVIYRHAGNTDYDVHGAAKVWNNGKAQAGLDHIQLYKRNANGHHYTICLHYGRQTTSQPDPTVANINRGEIVSGWRWRGECVGDEDTWRRVGD